MVRTMLVLAALVAATGCGRSHDVAGVTPRPVTAGDLSGRTFNVLAKNATESVILLGHLRFDPIAGTAVAGSWDLSPWSVEHSVPGLPASGAFAGSLEGSTLILRLPLADAEQSLGMVSYGFVGDRLAGTLSLLPSLGFEGRFEAIAAAE